MKNPNLFNTAVEIQAWNQGVKRGEELMRPLVWLSFSAGCLLTSACWIVLFVLL